MTDPSPIDQTNTRKQRCRNKRSGASRALAIMLLMLIVVTCIASISVQPQDNELTAQTSAVVGPPPFSYSPYVVVPYNSSKDIDNFQVLQAEQVPGHTYRWIFNDSEYHELTGYIPDYTWRHQGLWNVTLYVTDVISGREWIEYVTVNVIPKAYGRPDRFIMENDYDNLTVTLDAWRSESEFGIVDYQWAFTYGGEPQTFSGRNMTWRFEKAGKYPVHLTVTDGMGNKAYDNVTVTIKRLPYFYEKHWMLLFIGLPLIALVALWLYFKYKRDHAIFTSTDREKLRLHVKEFKITWRIFKANRLGFSGLIVLVIFVLMAVFAPILSTVPDPNNPINHEPNNAREDWENPMPPTFDESPKGWIHPFGTDQKGQDVYSSTLYGARASIEVGLAATLISVVMGALVGLGAGYFGRGTDEVLMRITDFFLVIPWFPLMIVMMAVLGREFIWVIVVIGITSWPSTARIVRSQVLTVKERQFIVRAKCVGATDAQILKKHIMPNVLPLIFANTVLLIAIAIFNEAFLDFFGLGDPDVVSWGTMLEGAYERDAFVSGAWWWIAAPGICIVAMVLAFSLVGYAIDDVLNPKLRRR